MFHPSCESTRDQTSDSKDAFVSIVSIGVIGLVSLADRTLKSSGNDDSKELLLPSLNLESEVLTVRKLEDSDEQGSAWQKELYASKSESKQFSKSGSELM